MSEIEKTFSESWYRVAPLQVKLRMHVRVHRQRFRGENWYILEDPFNNQYFRLRPEAYDFVSRLGPGWTVEEAWRACLKNNPEQAPGQEEVIQLLAQLFQANLIHTEMPADVASLFKRYKRRRQREIQSKLVSFMFTRFPLIDPDGFLKRLLPIVGKFISPLGAMIWVAFVLLGLKNVVEHMPELAEESRNVLAPGNLFLLYTGIVFLSILHEFGHAFTCRKYGGEVHTMGIMLLVFTPLPYVDTSASWTFRERWQRILVAFAGMISDFFVASIAVLIWANTGPGTLHDLAYNMMFAASVSTLLFNGNPLLRFDGYYILADLLNIPNLYSRAQNQLKYFFEHYLFGVRQTHPVASTREEAAWLSVYGVASTIYRVFLFAAIAFFVGHQFLAAGIILAFFLIIAWGVVPFGKFLHYLSTSPKLDRTRNRAVGISAALIGIPFVLLYFVPFPNGFVAPGVVESREFSYVSPQTEGRVVEVLTSTGSKVEEGTPLVRLENPELEIDLAEARAQLKEARARRQRALEQNSRELGAAKELIAAHQSEIESLNQERENLVIRASRDGFWSAPDLHRSIGQWAERGHSLGILLDDRDFRFSAVISQEEASRLFSGEILDAKIRVAGQSYRKLNVADLVMIPMQQKDLPSASLGYRGGGNVAVAQGDGSGTEASESFFEVRGIVDASQVESLFHGQRGKIRMTLPSEPLLRQWIRSFQQLVQKHYSG